MPAVSVCAHASCCVAGPAGERRLPGRVGSAGAAAESRAGSLQRPHEQRRHSETPAARTHSHTGLHSLAAAPSLSLSAVLHSSSTNLSLITLLLTFNNRAARTLSPACDFTAAVECFKLNLGQSCTDQTLYLSLSLRHFDQILHPDDPQIKSQLVI